MIETSPDVWTVLIGLVVICLGSLALATLPDANEPVTEDE